MNFTRFIILFNLLILCNYCIAQSLRNGWQDEISLLPRLTNFNISNPLLQLNNTKAAQKVKNSLLKISGNILYSANYRSYIDTPFAQQNLMQHYTQASLNFLIKDKYPVSVILSGRQSNSGYFRNALDVNLQFNRYRLLDNLKTGLQSRINGMVDKSMLTDAERLYQNKWKEVENIRQWLSSPAQLQALVEAKEKNILRKAELMKDTPNENLEKRVSGGIVPFSDSGILKKYNEKKEELNNQMAQLKQYENQALQAKKMIRDSVNKIQQEINRLNNPKAFYAFVKKQGLSRNEFTKAQRLLLAINQVGLGRTWIDYSELTVKNVSLTGVNIEANPGLFYVAVAAGKLNYRFRDFIIKNNHATPNQSLLLTRLGFGQKEKNNFIATFYTGKKSILNYPEINPTASLQQVMGISAEAKLALNSNNYIVAEVAKSSFNNNGSLLPNSSELLRKAFDLKIHNNEAYSIKLFSQAPQTNTRFTAFYRKMGENFESFTLYPIRINQDAWSVKLNQQLWKKRIVVDAAIRKNEFTSPITVPSFSSETIFKSLQVSLRIPKYPFISMGYYPSSQLSLDNSDNLIENQYNTLNTILSYNYRFRNITMNTGMVYTKFYNNSSDTGFIYYNATNLTVNHSIFLNKFTLQSNFAITQQKDLDFFSLEQALSYQFTSRFTLTGGLKWNRLNKEENLFGATAGLNIYVNHIGTFQFNYDKMYLPGYNRTLMPVDMGRMSIYREF